MYIETPYHVWNWRLELEIGGIHPQAISSTMKSNLGKGLIKTQFDRVLEIPDLSIFADVLIEMIYDYFIICAVFLSGSFFFPFSYCDQNIRHDEKFRRYSANIPVYLRNCQGILLLTV